MSEFTIPQPDRGQPSVPEITTDQLEWLTGVFSSITSRYAAKDEEIQNSVEFAAHGREARSAVEFVAHAERTVGLVGALAGKELSPIAIASSYLHDLVDRHINRLSHKSTPERREIIGSLLAELMGESSPLSEDQQIYLCGLLVGFVKTEINSAEHRKLSAEPATIDGEKVTIAVEEILKDSYQGVIDREVWKTIEPFVDFEHMHDFLEVSNIESVIVKACELIDNMHHPSSARPSALLQDVLEAESFYAPILEVLGYDGIASLLRGVAHEVRLRQLGLGGWVDRAKEAIDQISDIGADRVVSRIFGDPGDSVSRSVVGTDASGRVPVEIGEFAAVLDPSGQRAVAGAYRLKTVGSLAKKLDLQGGRMPNDLLGLTIISGKPRQEGEVLDETFQDIEQSAKDFAKFIKQKVIKGGFELRVAKNREQPIYAHGSRQYINLVRRELVRQGVDLGICQLKVDKAKNVKKRGYAGYRVAKVTFDVEMEGARGVVSVPAEVQFATKAERERARVGEVAHIIYKYLAQRKDLPLAEQQEIVGQAMVTLREMHGRRLHLDPNSLALNDETVSEAVDYLDAIANKKDYILAA